MLETHYSSNWKIHMVIMAQSLTQNELYNAHITSNQEPITHLWPILNCWDESGRGTSWKLRFIWGIKGMGPLTSVLHKLLLTFLMSSNNTTANTDLVCLFTFVSTYIFWPSVHTQKIMLQFACNPLMAFDDDLKHDFAFAWSLPPHPTFKRKMVIIKAAIDEAASGPCDYPRCRIFYFVWKISDAVRVSRLFSKPLHLN